MDVSAVRPSAMPSPSLPWYITRDGKQHGPLADAELKKLVDLGQLQPTDFLWRQDFVEWRPALALFPQLRPATRWSAGEEQGEARGHAARVVQPLATEVRSNDGAAEEHAEREWYLLRDGKRYGPFANTEVIAFQQTKQLQPTDLVWCEGFRDWQPVSVLVGAQQTVAPQWQLERTQRKVAQHGDQRQKVDVGEKGEPKKTGIAVWVWMTIQVSIALPSAILLGAAIAYAYRYVIG